jgi:hypothetical protein
MHADDRREGREEGIGSDFQVAEWVGLILLQNFHMRDEAECCVLSGVSKNRVISL